MANNKLRVGIAGYGVVGKRRRETIDQHPALKTTAVCDRVFPADGVFPDGVHYYTHYKRLLQEDLDVLFVCMTNDIAPSIEHHFDAVMTNLGVILYSLENECNIC